MTNVVIADDSALFREGIAGLLERQGFGIIAQPGDADELVRVVDGLAADNRAPGVVIADVRMPPTMTTDGLSACLRLKQHHPGLAVMVLSQYVAASYAQRLFALPPSSGGSGYLLKDRVANVAEFITSLRLVASGGVVIDPEVTTAMMRSRTSGLGELTAREFEVLELMARGMSNAQIADDLVLSGAAVAKHVSNVFAKLHLQPGEDNRRVRAILAYLSHSGAQFPG